MRGAHYYFPGIPKWGITCGHSPHLERLAAKPSTGGVLALGPLVPSGVHGPASVGPLSGVQGNNNV